MVVQPIAVLEHPRRLKSLCLPRRLEQEHHDNPVCPLGTMEEVVVEVQHTMMMLEYLNEVDIQVLELVDLILLVSFLRMIFGILRDHHLVSVFCLVGRHHLGGGCGYH
jgi:hypothetical protein